LAIAQRESQSRYKRGEQVVMKFYTSYSQNTREVMCRELNEEATGYEVIEDALADNWNFISNLTKIEINPYGIGNYRCYGQKVILEKR